MSKDVKSASAVLSQSVRGQTPASITRSVLVEKDGLDTDDDVSSAAAPTLSSQLSSDDLISFYRSGKKGIAHKRLQTWYDSTSPATAATAVPSELSDISQGTDEIAQRLGRQIRCNHLRFRGRFQWSGTNSSAVAAQIEALMIPQTVRVVIFWDLMPLVVGTNSTTEPSCIWAQNAVYATGMGALVLTGTYGAAHNVTAPWSPTTHGTRYHILRDELIRPKNMPVSGNSGGVTNATVGNQVTIDWTIPLHQKIITYSTATATSSIDRKLYMMIMQDAIVTGAAAIVFNLSADLEFEDVQQ